MSPRARVSASPRPSTPRLRVSVSDTGPGIPAEHLPYIFERFYRVDRSRSRALGGSGIGLTIARALVEGMGGEIRAESGEPGRGATFSFSLPLASA
jgi:signal transduction histidine kinase